MAAVGRRNQNCFLSVFYSIVNYGLMFYDFQHSELLWLQTIKKSKIRSDCNNWGLVSWIKINFMVIVGKKKSADAIKQSSGHHLALHEWVAYCRTKPAGGLQRLYDNDIDSIFTSTFIFTSIVFYPPYMSLCTSATCISYPAKPQLSPCFLVCFSLIGETVVADEWAKLFRITHTESLFGFYRACRFVCLRLVSVPQENSSQ